MNELSAQVNAKLARERWAYVFLAVGLILVLVTLFFGVRDASGYAEFLSHTKAERDAALAGSTLLAQQAELESIEPWTKPLAFTGMGFLLTGIGLMLWNIVYRIQMRAKCIGVCVPLAVQQARASS